MLRTSPAIQAMSDALRKCCGHFGDICVCSAVVQNLCGNTRKFSFCVESLRMFRAISQTFAYSFSACASKSRHVAEIGGASARFVRGSSGKFSACAETSPPPPPSPDSGNSLPWPLTASSEIRPCSLLHRSRYWAKLPHRRGVPRCTTMQSQLRPLSLR